MSLHGLERNIADRLYVLISDIRELQNERDMYRDALIAVRELNDSVINDIRIEDIISDVLLPEEGE